MAYCKNCGAYIPEGQTVCLACGEEDIPMGGQAAQKAPSQKERSAEQEKNELLREQLEEQRKRQQENNRKWAEAEYAQRRRAEENNRQYNEQRRQSKETQGTYRRTNTQPTQTFDPMQKSKIFAVLSYLSALFILPFLFCRNDEFALYHAKQGMILFIAELIAKGIGTLFGIGWAATLAKLYFMYKGMDNAAHMRKQPLPYIGKMLK